MLFCFKEINLSSEYGKKTLRLSNSRLAFVPILLLSRPTFNLQTDDSSIVAFFEFKKKRKSPLPAVGFISTEHNSSNCISVASSSSLPDFFVFRKWQQPSRSFQSLIHRLHSTHSPRFSSRTSPEVLSGLKPNFLEPIGLHLLYNLSFGFKVTGPSADWQINFN